MKFVIAFVAVLALVGCGTPCGAPFSNQCKVDVVEGRCWDPEPVACQRLGDGATLERLREFYAENPTTDSCEAEVVQLCPDGQHYAVGYVNYDTYVVIYDAMTGECVAGNVPNDDIDQDAACRTEAAWTGPRDLLACAEPVFAPVSALFEEGCWLFDGECQGTPGECRIVDLE